MRGVVALVLSYIWMGGFGAIAQASSSIDVPAKEKLVMESMGRGVQVYTCAEKDSVNSWTFKEPEAKLSDSFGKVIGSHFAGPKWRLDDGSEVQGKLVGTQAHGGTIPWLLLTASSTGHKGKLSTVDLVRRTDTQGGSPPMAGCDASHAGVEVRVPYTAMYSFYSAR